MKALAAFVCALASAAVLAPAAGADNRFVVTDGTSLATGTLNTLPTLSAPTAITGLQPGEQIVAIDQRPDTGQLYGIGSTSRTYVINPVTGAAIGAGGAGTYALSGTAFGMDFIPTVDRIRVLSDDEQNLRINPDTGALAVVDSPVNPAGDVVAAAYNNNKSGVMSSTLYAIDSGTAKLYTFANPNTGTRTEVGSLGVTPTSKDIGFDVSADGIAAATITTAGGTNVYGINTATGAATNLGQVGDGTTPYSGFAFMSARLRMGNAAQVVTSGLTAQIPVTRSALPSGAVSVHYFTTGGSADNVSDFTPSSGTVSWGADDAETKFISVPIPANSAGEGDEMFSVTLSSPVTGSDVALGSPTTTFVTIAADTQLQFARASTTAREGRTAKLRVSRSGSTTHAVSVDYETVRSSAETTDFVSKSGTISWAAGDGAAKTISVPIRDDGKSEGAETFRVFLSNAAGGGAKLGSPTIGRVTIPASDPVPVLRLKRSKSQKLRRVRRKGVAVVATVNRSCRLDALLRRSGHRKRLGRTRRTLSPGKHKLRIKVRGKKNRRKLRAGQRLTVSAVCANANGKSLRRKRSIKLKR